MRNLKHTKEITESFAMNEIFNACRGNEARIDKGGVAFVKLASMSKTEYGVVLSTKDGVLVATAIVDEFDV